jgi:hypothetical protein
MLFDQGVDNGGAELVAGRVDHGAAETVFFTQGDQVDRAEHQRRQTPAGWRVVS